MRASRKASAVTAFIMAATLCASVHAQAPTQRKVRDGEAAVDTTVLSESDATARVKHYFNTKNIDFTVNPETKRLITDWFNERGCGIGFNKCASRANVRIASEEGQTLVIVQVFERKREAGLSPKPWNENAKSKGKETAALADSLSARLKN